MCYCHNTEIDLGVCYWRIEDCRGSELRRYFILCLGSVNGYTFVVEYEVIMGHGCWLAVAIVFPKFHVGPSLSCCTIIVVVFAFK